MDVGEALATLTIEQLLQRWPRTAQVFYQFGMACVGCPVATFYGVTKAARIYHLDEGELLAAMAKVVIESNATAPTA